MATQRRDPTITALADIMAERFRQVHELGHTMGLDAERHADGALGRAAAARLALVASYALGSADSTLARDLRNMAIVLDPWSSAPNFLRAPVRRLLVEAGALAAAELERVDLESEGGP